MTLDDLIAEVAAEELSAEALAVAAIKPYDVERSNETTAKAAKDKKGDVLREWFKTHPEADAELVDIEWNLRAYMQKGGIERRYDAPAVVKAENPKLYARCEALGLLRFDDGAVQKALKDGLLTHGDLAGYVHPGSGSPSLQVKAIKT